MAFYGVRVETTVMSTILVVDDDASFAQALCLTLEHNGFEVFRAADGTEVPDVLSKVQVDAMVLDLHMPGMNGWEVIRALRDLFKESRTGDRRRPKVVVLSGRDEAETVTFVTRLGADAYLTKPVGGDQIVQTLREVLAK